MLEKLLRAPLPEQVVALLEKLEQDPDASHLKKVERLLEYHATKLTGYERWIIKRQLRKNYREIRRVETLNNVMSIVINDRSDEEEQLRLEQERQAKRANMYASMAQHAAAQQAHIAAHQAQMNMYTEQLRNTYLTGSSQ